ncbi:MAG: M48 family metallopeptidase [Planctomycetes bacterium]|nr:M48 family metallopeptidase [Planctomycetota bacterium]
MVPWSAPKAFFPSIRRFLSAVHSGRMQKVLMENPVEIPLLDNPLLILMHFGNESRFVTLFQSTWKRIPEDDRRLIGDYWSEAKPTRIPICELSNCWIDHAGKYGQCTANGYELRFDASAFLILPENVATFVIAHELAHVFQKAEGNCPGGANQQENEGDANFIAEKWKFDRIALLTLEAFVKLDGFEKACRTLSGDADGVSL